MDLPICRLRQIVAAINRRTYLRRREEISLTSWQTRQLSSFIAAGYMTDGKGNPALDAAAKLAFDRIEEAQLEEAEQARLDTPVEPLSGSYERFMGSFGNANRWGGR